MKRLIFFCGLMAVFVSGIWLIPIIALVDYRIMRKVLRYW